MQSELRGLIDSIKECSRNREHVKELTLLGQMEELANKLNTKFEEAKTIADSNIGNSLQEILVFVQQNYL